MVLVHKIVSATSHAKRSKLNRIDFRINQRNNKPTAFRQILMTVRMMTDRKVRRVVQREPSVL
jgi:hypothetical protein